MKQIILLVSIFTFINSNAQTWSLVGSASFTNETSDTSISVNDNNGDIFVHYVDGLDQEKNNVYKYNGTSWSSVGSLAFGPFSVSSTGSNNLIIDNSGSPYIAYQDNSGGPYQSMHSVMRFDGSNWVLVGVEGFTGPSSTSGSLERDNFGFIYYAFRDGNVSNKGSVMVYSGGSWQYVGNAGFSSGLASNCRLTFDNNNVPYVVFADASQGSKLSAMSLTNGNWSILGSLGFSDGLVNDISIDTDENNNLYVAYTDAANTNKATVKRYNGSNWETIGTTGFSDGVASDIALELVNNTPYVIYSDNSISNGAICKTFNGTNWITFGQEGITSSFGNKNSITFFDGALYCATRDFSNGGGISVFSITSPTLGVHNIDDINLTLTPNPSRDFISISGLTAESPFVIYNVLGHQVLKSITLNSKIDIQNLSKGLYFLELKNKKTTLKFIKD